METIDNTVSYQTISIKSYKKVKKEVTNTCNYKYV
jgi:hypothetical protein